MAARSYLSSHLPSKCSRCYFGCCFIDWTDCFFVVSKKKKIIKKIGIQYAHVVEAICIVFILARFSYNKQIAYPDYYFDF